MWLISQMIQDEFESSSHYEFEPSSHYEFSHYEFESSSHYDFESFSHYNFLDWIVWFKYVLYARSHMIHIFIYQNHSQNFTFE